MDIMWALSVRAAIHRSLPNWEAWVGVLPVTSSPNSGCQVGKVYTMVLRENHAVCALLVVLLEFVTQPKKKSKQGTTETYEETAARQSSPRSWVVAHSLS